MRTAPSLVSLIVKNAPDTSFEGRSSKDPYLCPRFSLGEFVRQRLHRMIRIPSRQAAGRSLTVSPVEHRADSSSAEPGPRALHGDHVVASTHEADASLGSEPPKNSRIPPSIPTLCRAALPCPVVEQRTGTGRGLWF